jgi:hypothetical protein
MPVAAAWLPVETVSSAPSSPARPRRGLSPVFVVAIVAAMAALTTLYIKVPHRGTSEASDRTVATIVAGDPKAPNTKTSTSTRSAPAQRTTTAEVSQPRATPSASAKPRERSATKAAVAVQHAVSPTPVSVHITFEAESYSVNHGTQNSFPSQASGGQTVGHTSAGDWVGYASRSMTGVHTVTLRTTAGKGGATVQIRASSSTGPLLGAVFLPETPDFDTFETVTAKLMASSSGPLFIDFLGPTAADIDTVTLSS